MGVEQSEKAPTERATSRTGHLVPMVVTTSLTQQSATVPEVILHLAEQRLLVAHRGHLALIREGDPRPRTFDVGEGTLVRLVAGSAGYFAVKHHSFSEPPVRVITAHHASDPDVAVARLTIDDDWSVTGTGEAAAWDHLPRLFDLVYPYLLHFDDETARIIKLPGIPGQPETPHDPYRSVPCPGADSAVVTQTSGGRFVVYNLADGSISADVTIGSGRPVFRFEPATALPWLARHDTVVRFGEGWRPTSMFRIRNTVRGSIISDVAFREDGAVLAVAFSERRPVPMIQPYRLAPVDGGVMLVDAATMEVIGGAATDRWVDEIAFLEGDRLALRERAGEIELRFAAPEAVDWKLYPPRPEGEEWL